MTSVAHSQPMPMRRSQRRKNKYLNREEVEYSIPNPYRAAYSQQCLPDILGKQLAKLDYLSTRSLKDLSFPDAGSYQEMDEVLAKMRCAAKKQQEEFQAILIRHYQEEKRRLLQAQCFLDEQDPEHNQPDEQPKDDQSMDIQQSEDMLQSEHVSIFGDNYEADRLVFYSDHSIHGCMKDDFDLI